MAVGLRRGGQLAGEIRDGDELLASRLEIAQLDLTIGKLVADDDREVGVVACRRLELLRELADGELRAYRQAGRPQVGRDPQSIRGPGRIRTDDNRERPGLGRRRGAHGREGEDDPIESEPEADPRCRPPAEKLDEPVIPPTAAERLLLALAPGA